MATNNERTKSRHYEELSERLKAFSRDMRKEPPDAEYKLWYFLQNRQLAGFKFRRQHQVGSYIVDFICIKAKLVIELDGGQHYDSDKIVYDEKRTAFLNSRGLKVIRFDDNDVMRNIEGVVIAILEELGVDCG
jgi:adenine-specific DNA-methyltransferase